MTYARRARAILNEREEEDGQPAVQTWTLNVTGPHDDIGWRVEAFRQVLGGNVPFPLPTDLSIRNLLPQLGRCPCCGEGQPYGQTRRCVRCCLAASRLQEAARLARSAG